MSCRKWKFPGPIKLPLEVVAAVLSAAWLVGCSTGAYPTDVFPEGHYQQSYRSQEPPRLQPARDSVPITGREINYGFGEASNLTNSLPNTPETMVEARRVYKVNCEVCHGASGRGDGPMTPYFQKAGPSVPVDFTSARVRGRKEGELYWIVTNGLGLMPRFGPLLTPEERWAVVHYVRSVSASSP